MLRLITKTEVIDTNTIEVKWENKTDGVSGGYIVKFGYISVGMDVAATAEVIVIKQLLIRFDAILTRSDIYLTISNSVIKKCLTHDPGITVSKFCYFLRALSQNLKLSVNANFLVDIDCDEFETLTINSYNFRSIFREQTHCPTIGDVTITSHAVERFASRVNGPEHLTAQGGLEYYLNKKEMYQRQNPERLIKEKIKKYGTGLDVETWCVKGTDVVMIILRKTTELLLLTVFCRNEKEESPVIYNF